MGNAPSAVRYENVFIVRHQGIELDSLGSRDPDGYQAIAHTTCAEGTLSESRSAALDAR